MTDSRSAVERTTNVEKARHRAQLAHELAERVYEPVEPLRAGAGFAIACDLYLQATYWVLCALQHGGRAVSSTEAWEAADALTQWAVPDDAARTALGELFVGNTSRELALLNEHEQRQRATDARALAHAAFERLEAPVRARETKLLLRGLRLVFALGFAVLIVVGGYQLVVDKLRGPDLLVGRPFHTSSVWAVCDPVAERCASLHSKILFHTKEDPNPWVVYDLGKRTTFSRIYVKNRTDEAPDRVAPLVVEVSDDDKTYRKVARHEDTFRTWTETFAPQTARYLRLRVDRRSYLHLEQVMLFR